jgi:hypothetical protein
MLGGLREVDRLRSDARRQGHLGGARGERGGHGPEAARILAAGHE